MNINTFLVVLTGLFIRLVLPLAVTALVVYWLHRLDMLWQAEAERERELLVKDEMPCGRQQGLSVDEIKLRAEKNDQPCWQTYRLSNGYLRDDCLDCDVFLTAPIPTPKHSPVHL